jgi:hypothetical protein
MRTSTAVGALAVGMALCVAGCGTSLKEYTCRDVSASSAKREALAEVIVVQLRAQRRVVKAPAVARTIERVCTGEASERLAPDAKPYAPVLKQIESEEGVRGAGGGA